MFLERYGREEGCEKLLLGVKRLARVRAMILGGTDEVKEWTGTLEGTPVDDGIDYVAVNEMSPVLR